MSLRIIHFRSFHLSLQDLLFSCTTVIQGGCGSRCCAIALKLSRLKKKILQAKKCNCCNACFYRQVDKHESKAEKLPYQVPRAQEFPKIGGKENASRNCAHSRTQGCGSLLTLLSISVTLCKSDCSLKGRISQIFFSVMTSLETTHFFVCFPKEHTLE